MPRHRLVNIDPANHGDPRRPYYECSICTNFLTIAADKDRHETSPKGYRLSEKAVMEATQMLLEHYFRETTFQVEREVGRGKGPSGRSDNRCDWGVLDYGDNDDLLLVECKKVDYDTSQKLYDQLHGYCMQAAGYSVHQQGVWGATLVGTTMETFAFDPTVGLHEDELYFLMDTNLSQRERAHRFFLKVQYGRPFA